MDGKRRIGEYDVVRLLGKGGMSEVYEVENPRLGSRHALKLFTYEKNDPEVKERFLTEGKLLARLSHPRIVKVTDFGTDGASGRPYFVMDLVLNERGGMQQLSDVEPGTVDEETVGKWYDDLREGLAYIHSNGVIHRDLKLQNVLIGPDGHAVITDFGISKIFDAKGDGVQVVDTVKTLVKVREGRSLVMGSLGYMAPELEMGVAASRQSDWYALGIIVYRLLTGTWCDARTDVVGTLETYDPVWSRIVPKLLHSNPNGRECLSYAGEKRADRERIDREWEERWLREKGRGRFARHLAWYIGFAAAAVLLVIVWLTGRYEREVDAVEARLASAEAQLARPAFADVFKIEDLIGDTQSVRRVNIILQRETLTDVWILTRGIFEDLRLGRISTEKAIESLDAMASRAETDCVGLFGLENTPRGDIKMLPKLLKIGVNNMKSINYCENKKKD